MLKCHDCELPYGSDAWADVVIPDFAWKLIAPQEFEQEGGVLCFNCMNNRLTKLKLRNVPYQIASGPMSFSVRSITNKTREYSEDNV